MTRLAHPLTLRQVDAAGRLHDRLQQWRVSDGALQRLSDRCPGFGPEETLLKVVAINALYGTNVYAQVRMAGHVCKTLQGTDLKRAGPELVEAMARMPKSDEQLRDRIHLSFASKFAHFFLNRDRFPIMDSYALRMVRHHLGPRNCLKVQQGAYVTFVANVELLTQCSNLRCSGRELDRYLWLAGLYHSWRKNPKSKINREVAMLFAHQSEKVVCELRAMIGQ